MVKVSTENDNDRIKELLQKTKDGFIQKKKNQKLKQMSANKVDIINRLKPSNGNNEAKQQLNKQKNSGSKKSAEQNTKDSPKGDKKLRETAKNNKAESEEDDFDSDEDINEGILLEEYSFLQESSEAASEDEEESEDDSENGHSLPNILGTSLADDTDEDDDDYEEDEDAEEVNKGVKMFKGLKSKEKTTDVSEKKLMDESQISSDNDDEEDDDDEEQDDEDFTGESSDDEEESDVEDEDDEEVEDEDEDEDDEDEDEDVEGESEDEGDESMLSWEAIMGNSLIADDEDDDNFEPDNMDEDDDDDISDEEEDEEEEKSNSGSSTKEKTKKPKEILDASLEELKQDKRTIFVGNLPKEVTRKQLKKHFKKFGAIDTVRVRGIIGKSLKMSKKVAAIKNDLHPKLKSVFAYIKYKSEACAKAALSMNGKVFDGNHLRVDLAFKSDDSYDTKKAVFVGNIHFSIDENTIRKHFKGCGEIESIRIIRDNKTGIGKGFGYVNFKTEDAAALALELNGTSLLNRELRVKPCSDHPKKEKKDKQKKRQNSSEEEKKSNKKFKQNEEVAVPVHNKKNAMKRLNEKGQKFDAKQTSPQQSKSFQGQTSEGKKKKKSNKLEKKKKMMAEKLAAKPKKPSN